MRKHDTSNGANGTATALADAPPLQSGDHFTRPEFLRVWEPLPEIKFATLIGGTVYTPSPVTRQHGSTDYGVGGWLCVYHAQTPGTETGGNVTTMISKSKVFPGLRLDGAAMLACGAARVLAVLHKGLRSPEHAAFVQKLARRKKK